MLPLINIPYSCLRLTMNRLLQEAFAMLIICSLGLTAKKLKLQSKFTLLSDRTCILDPSSHFFIFKFYCNVYVCTGLINVIMCVICQVWILSTGGVYCQHLKNNSCLTKTNNSCHKDMLYNSCQKDMLLVWLSHYLLHCEA